MWTFPGFVLGFGALLILFEWNTARKKKGGITWTDKQSMLGILKVTLVLAVVAYVFGWMLE